MVETPKGTFKIKLFTDDPAVKGAVDNFRNKVASGYFDGKIFHRVEDWVVQGGDPLGNGTGGGDMPGEYTRTRLCSAPWVWPPPLPMPLWSTTASGSSAKPTASS